MDPRVVFSVLSLVFALIAALVAPFRILCVLVLTAVEQYAVLDIFALTQQKLCLDQVVIKHLFVCPSFVHHVTIIVQICSLEVI